MPLPIFLKKTLAIVWPRYPNGWWAHQESVNLDRLQVRELRVLDAYNLLRDQQYQYWH